MEEAIDASLFIGLKYWTIPSKNILKQGKMVQSFLKKHSVPGFALWYY